MLDAVQLFASVSEEERQQYEMGGKFLDGLASHSRSLTEACSRLGILSMNLRSSSIMTDYDLSDEGIRRRAFGP